MAAGITAYASYFSTSRYAATSHMHSLFKAYLDRRYDVQKTLRDGRLTKRDSYLLKENLAAYLLYVLEEMFAWVEREEAQNRRIVPRFLPGVRRQPRGDLVHAWRATIVTHLLQEREYALKSMKEYTCCYSVRFLAFANAYLQDKQLADLITCSECALAVGRNRPLGAKEVDQRPSATVRGVDCCIRCDCPRTKLLTVDGLG